MRGASANDLLPDRTSGKHRMSNAGLTGPAYRVLVVFPGPGGGCRCLRGGADARRTIVLHSCDGLHVLGAVVVVNVQCRLVPVPVFRARRTIRRRNSLPAVPGEVMPTGLCVATVSAIPISNSGAQLAAVVTCCVRCHVFSVQIQLRLGFTLLSPASSSPSSEDDEERRSGVERARAWCTERGGESCGESRDFARDRERERGRRERAKGDSL